MRKILLPLLLFACAAEREAPKKSLGMFVLLEREIIVEKFVFDSAEVPRGEVEAVAAAALKVGKASKRYVVHLVGYTDDYGSDLLNRRLGMMRAEAVADIMVLNGIERDRIIVESRGKDRTFDDYSLDRRVEMEVLCGN